MLSHERTEVFFLFTPFTTHTRRVYIGPQLQHYYFFYEQLRQSLLTLLCDESLLPRDAAGLPCPFRWQYSLLSAAYQGEAIEEKSCQETYLGVLFSKFLQATGLTIKNAISFSSFLVWDCTTYTLNQPSAFSKRRVKVHILSFLGMLD